MLPHTRTQLGFEQRLCTVNPDLSHEEIPEIVFPDCLGTIEHQADLLEVRFLVLGDQNAGKSTFLHSLVDHNSSHSTELLSFIPSLSSSFVNARFFLNDKEDRNNLMDEPPFIDTDIARAATLVTLESFRFMSLEAGAEFDVPDGTRYVALEFAEFGGDHLDRIAAFNGGDDIEVEIIQSSMRIIRECAVAAYFINCASMFNGADVCQSRLNQTRERLQLLRLVNPRIDVLLVAARTDDLAQINVIDALKEYLGCQIFTSNHMISGRITASGIFDTVCAMIRHSCQKLVL